MENDEFFVFSIGAREWLIDDDFAYAIVGGVPVVSKEDGSVSSRPSASIATDDSIVSRPNPAPTLRV